MANFEQAVTKTLAAEGGFFYNHTTGEVVNLGITLATLRGLGVLKTTGPPLQSDIDFVRALTEDEAKDIYHAEYWAPLHLDEIASQEVAAKVFDLAVNMGVVSAARLLQGALGITQDGIVGPMTVGRANATDSAELMDSIRIGAAARYLDIAKANPLLAGNLAGWLSRLNS